MSKTRSAARLRAEAAKVVDAVVVHGRSLDGALEAHESSVDPADQPMVTHGADVVLRDLA
jgi:hypothetical protein